LTRARWAALAAAWLLAALPGAAQDLGLPAASRDLPLPEGVLPAQGRPVDLLRRLARGDLLDVNLLVAPGLRAGGEPVSLRLAGVTRGEAARLLLQLGGLRLARAGARTFVLTDAEDTRSYGRQRWEHIRPVRVLPSRVLERLRANPELVPGLDPERVHADDARGELHLAARPEQLRALRRLVRDLEGPGELLFGRIPVSHLDEAGVRAALEALPEGVRARLPGWTFQDRARMVVARGTASQLARLQDTLRAADLPPAQAQLLLTLAEVERSRLARLGLTLGSEALRLPSLDAPGDATPNRIGGTLEVFFERLGARVLGSRLVTVMDGEEASLHLGEVRVVQGAASFDPVTGLVLAGAPREVPLGIQVRVEARVHHDGTATFALDWSEEEALAIRPDGVDRSSRALATQVRARRGEPMLIGGLDQRRRSRRPQGTQAAERRAQASELVLGLTYLGDPAAPKSRSESRSAADFDRAARKSTRN